MQSAGYWIHRLLAVVLIGFCCPGRASAEEAVRIEKDGKRIAFTGTLFPRRYNRYRDRQQGHHLVVWSGGRNASKALIETDVPDEKILAALETIGARPGNNLTEETWTERDDPSSAEPDKHVEGTEVEVTVEWDGSEHSAQTLFQALAPKDLQIRVGGHREMIPVWRSGCVTCLFSCPGGRTSNAAYTIRDQARKRMNFLADEEHLPPDGTNVVVRMRVKE